MSSRASAVTVAAGEDAAVFKVVKDYGKKPPDPPNRLKAIWHWTTPRHSPLRSGPFVPPAEKVHPKQLWEQYKKNLDAKDGMTKQEKLCVEAVKNAADEMDVDGEFFSEIMEEIERHFNYNSSNLTPGPGLTPYMRAVKGRIKAARDLKNNGDPKEECSIERMKQELDEELEPCIKAIIDERIEKSTASKFGKFELAMDKLTALGTTLKSGI
ncbi:hypothetical protein F5Y10DRAFT_261692 [Nemania abortiva]|nr:hypothetical protein F5Y10DRAFT_261692 [Nemania abortiva]